VSNFIQELDAHNLDPTRLVAVDALRQLNCCCNCIFRFLDIQHFPLYRADIQVQEGVLDALSLTHTTASRSGEKCRGCLGILQSNVSSSCVDSLLQEFADCGYEFDNYILSVGVPISILTRQFSLWYYLSDYSIEDESEGNEESNSKGNYFRSFPDSPLGKIVEVKEAFKWMLGFILKDKMNLEFDRDSPFEARVFFQHPETDNEHSILNKIENVYVRPNKRRRREMRGQKIEKKVSVTVVNKILNEMTKDKFKEIGGSFKPEEIKTVCSYDISFFRLSIYVAGRYNKLSRHLSQTPWILNGQRMTETSVEELIGEKILCHFKADGFKFSASGREDVDVRMLGTGRPFVFELINPHRITCTTAQFAEIQKAINGHTNEIQIRDLQRVEKSACSALKEGGADKTKSYRCIIWSKKELGERDLDFLEEIKNLDLNQKTPLRVLHRRSLATRIRTVYNLRGKVIAPHFAVIDLETQAGTYVKEFIHGDLGRTSPNFCELLNTECDILQLDVLKVLLDFPPSLTPEQ